MICKDRQEKESRARERMGWGLREWEVQEKGLGMFYKCRKQRSRAPRKI